MYTEKYRPQKFAEIAGQPSALKELISWFNTWPEQKKVAVLYGRAGVGKTSAVISMAREFRADLIELNASDQRNKDVIDRIVGNAATTCTLDGRKKIILLDEADNIYGREDKGGNQALSRIIDKTRNPIILIANEYWEIPPGIRNKSKMIEFRTLLPASILKVLRRVALEEGLDVSDERLQEISSNVNGDLRAALNDLESLTSEKYYNPRDTQTSIFQALSSVFRLQSADVRKEFFGMDKEPREVLLWVAENMPLVYEPQDAARAYYYLSRADMFLGRAFRNQYYKLWGYASDLMTSGVSVARLSRYHFQRFRSPSYFTALARSKKDRAMRDEIRKKISEKCHCSSSEAGEYVIMMQALEKQTEKAAGLCRFFELDEDEILYVFRKGEKILKVLETATSRRMEKSEKEERIQEPDKKDSRQKTLADF
ncbi:MAG: replication factor C large subunit [Theionarchaea archaeon]|nr:replication factor C large subunit [Theionarchaea archaeon]